MRAYTTLALTHSDGYYNHKGNGPVRISFPRKIRQVSTGQVGTAFQIQDGDGDIFLKVELHTVAGRLLPSETFTDLTGLKIRLDLKEWEPMVTTDADGRFVLPQVPDGKHRLTAYLPFNLRTDRGVGHTMIEVKGSDMGDVQLKLETLSTIHMTITDESGKPLEGISAAAWWTENHSGVFTEGTKSNTQGQATLYLYPEQAQYVGAHDWSNKYTLTGHRAVTSKKGEVINGLKVMMRPAAR